MSQNADIKAEKTMSVAQAPGSSAAARAPNPEASMKSETVVDSGDTMGDANEGEDEDESETEDEDIGNPETIRVRIEPYPFPRG